jgi:hypothetical protein
MEQVVGRSLQNIIEGQPTDEYVELINRYVFYKEDFSP